MNLIHIGVNGRHASLLVLLITHSREVVCLTKLVAGETLH